MTVQNTRLTPPAPPSFVEKDIQNNIKNNIKKDIQKDIKFKNNQDINIQTKDLKIRNDVDIKTNSFINEEDSSKIILKTKDFKLPPKLENAISDMQKKVLQSGTSINIQDKDGKENTILPKPLLDDFFIAPEGKEFIVKNEDSKEYKFIKPVLEDMEKLPKSIIMQANDGTQKEVKFPKHKIDIEVNQENMPLIKMGSFEVTDEILKQGFTKVNANLYKNDNVYAKVDGDKIIFRGFRI
jgi:hypothetical protein